MLGRAAARGRRAGRGGRRGRCGEKESGRHGEYQAPKTRRHGQHATRRALTASASFPTLDCSRSLLRSARRRSARLPRVDAQAMPSTYEPLAQEGDDVFGTVPSSSAVVHPIPIKPETYYGEGPFDPPSSDDEADSFLGKEDERSGRAIEAEGDLVVGSRKVRV